VSRSPYLLAGLFYLVLAVCVMDGVWRSPRELLIGLPEDRPIAKLGRMDQKMVLATVASGARAATSAPARLLAGDQCYPFPRSYTLGEHMIGNALLAALPMRLSGDPILSYNLVLVATLWIAAMSMFALILPFTGSLPAALVAGLVFGFARYRLMDPVHPYVHGDLWTPLALLSLYRLFDRADARSALALALFGSLILGESVYVVLSSALLLGVCGVWLAVQHRRRLAAIAPKLLLCLVVAGVVAWLVLGPYLETTRAWDAAKRRGGMFATAGGFLPGYEFSPGTLLSMLAAVGLADRLRGARPGPAGDPRVAIAIGGALAFSCSVFAVPIPLLDVKLPSPFVLLKGVVPYLDVIRAPSGLRFGFYLSLVVLAAYGVLLVTERLRSARARNAVVLALIAAFLVETLVPSIATKSFGSPIRQQAYLAAPPREWIDLLRTRVEGPVLDYPLLVGNISGQSRYLLDAAYHGQPTAACYNSIASPLQPEIGDLATALPAPEAAEALAHLGFGAVVLHREHLPPDMIAAFEAGLDSTENAGGRMEQVGESGEHVVYRLRPLAEASSSTERLAPPRPVAATVGEGEREAKLDFAFENRGPLTFVHPEPIAPRSASAEWRDAAGVLVLETPVRVLLPLALAPGKSRIRTLALPPPSAAGTYSVTLAFPPEQPAG